MIVSSKTTGLNRELYAEIPKGENETIILSYAGTPSHKSLQIFERPAYIAAAKPDGHTETTVSELLALIAEEVPFLFSLVPIVQAAMAAQQQREDLKNIAELNFLEVLELIKTHAHGLALAGYKLSQLVLDGEEPTHAQVDLSSLLVQALPSIQELIETSISDLKNKGHE